MSERTSSPTKYFTAGGFGGVCSVVAGHPLDTIKVRLQTMAQPKPGMQPLYSGTWDCALKTVRAEGFKGLYKGMGAPVMGVAPIFALSFLGFDVGKQLLQHLHTEKQLEALQLFEAGAFSGILTSIIITPAERIKCLLQVQHDQTEVNYKGPNDVIMKLYRTGGIRSLYKGICATILRDLPASGTYFMTYESIQKAINPPGTLATEISLLRTIFAGGMAGIAYWVVCMPADVLKSRLQTAREGTYRNGVREVFVKLHREEGLLALYKGLTAVMLRAFPANAACFVGFECAMKFLNRVAPGL